ncbi:DUF6463 family protein [Nonomuraea sp. NPDC001831]|uniref:DUF6463 family protein n=1 Tax=Nonomuraea sp. NPDC001831 TaxID=3364340 RepID=UPI00369BA23A
MSTSSPPPTATPPSRLTVWAGRAMIFIALAHTAVFAPLAPWASWLAGDLRNGLADGDSQAVFWALPGGFVVVLALLGLLVARTGRQGQQVPGYVGWAILVWGAIGVGLIGMSGFITAIVPSGLLIAANVIAGRENRDRRTVRGGHDRAGGITRRQTP